MAVVIFINLKGGVAKTTNAVAIAECLASKGKKTLVIDADHQCAATEVLLGEARMEELEYKRRTLHDMLLDMLKPSFGNSRFDHFAAGNASNIDGGMEHLSVIPGSVRITDYGSKFYSRASEFGSLREMRSLFDAHRKQFKRWLDDRFDFTIIDCPPNLAFQVKQLLRISDAYVVPCQPNRLSMRGADWLREKLRKDGFRRQPLGTLWSMCRGQDSQHQYVIDESVYGEFEHYRFPRPFNASVPLAAKIAHAVENGEECPTSFCGKYGSHFSSVFVDLANEMITRLYECGVGDSFSSLEGELVAGC